MTGQRPRPLPSAVGRAKGNVAMAQKAVEIILMRQLASYLAVPIFLVDPEGNLLYYNEPAERLLGRRYDETGEMPLATWSTAFTPTAEDGSPLAPEDLPLAIALQKRRAAHGRWPSRASTACPGGSPSPPFRSRGRGSATSAPSRSSGRSDPGEVHALGHARLAGGAGPDTVRYGGNTSCVEVRATDGSVLVLDAGTGIRRLGAALRGDVAPHRRAADAPAHGPHPGPRLLRAVLRAGLRGAPLGSGRPRRRPSATRLTPLPVAAAVPRAAPRAAVPTCDSTTCRWSAFEIGAFRVQRRARLPSGADRRLPHRRPTAPGSRTSPTTSRRSGLGRVPDDAGLDLRIRPRRRGRRADPRRAVQRERVRRPRRLGPQRPRATRWRSPTTTGVRRLVTFHHDPEHDDDMLGRLLDEARGTVAHPFAIVPGTEGLSLDLGAD